jgi:hypothetical protein
MTAKRKILYFTPGSKYLDRVVENNHEPVIHRMHKFLNHEFDVIYIENDCDLLEVVNSHQPYALLFDGVLEGCFDLQLKIENINALPHIPRAGLLRTDSMSPTTAMSVSLLQSYGVDGFFTVGDSGTWQTVSSITDSLYFLPWFIDDEVFKDYGEEKTVPIVMFGTFDAECYPWRKAVKGPILDHLPALYFRHPGYDKKKEMKQSALQYSGERYARMLNRALLAPSSGGFNNFVISKQLEIPATRTVLVTHDTPVVRAYGFENWKNCIFADHEDIVPLCKRVLEDSSLTKMIADSGYNLVHSKHTYRNRHQLTEWFELKKALIPGYKIIQPDILKPLELERIESEKTTIHFACNPYYDQIEKSDLALKNGSLIEAEGYALKAYNYCGYTAEANFRLSFIYLLQGRIIEAIQKISNMFEFLGVMNSPHPDPNAFALNLLASACARDIPELSKCFQTNWKLRSPFLDLVRIKVVVIVGDDDWVKNVLDSVKQPEKPTLSAVNFPHFSLDDFSIWLDMILVKYKLIEPGQSSLHRLM